MGAILLSSRLFWNLSKKVISLAKTQEMWWSPQAKKKKNPSSVYLSVCDLQCWPWNERRICSLLCGVCVMRTMMKSWRQVLCGWQGGCLGRWRCFPPDWGSCIRCSSVCGPPAHRTAAIAEAVTAYPPACEVASLKNLAEKIENMSKVSVCALARHFKT